MKTSTKIIISTLLVAVGFLVIQESLLAKNSQRSYFVSIVEKGSVQTFFNRLVTSDHHLVVTSQPVNSAIQSQKITLTEDQELLIVEPRSGEPKEVVEADATLDRFALVVLPNWGGAQHFHIGDQFNYVEMAKRTEQTYISRAKNFDFYTEPQVENIKFPKIDKKYLIEKLSAFSGESEIILNGRPVTIEERGSENGKNLARAWLAEQYEKLGFQVSEHSYKGGINFIAERSGADSSKFLMVTAHLDSVRNAGADDDGAGTISALAIADALSDFDLKYNLRIVGFDQEELGLIGSARYAQKLNEENGFAGLIGVINMEMTAYDRDGDFAFHVIDCNENSSADLSETMMNALTQLNLDLTKVDACTNRSDHASFWKYDQPAIVISQNFFGGDSNPCYHRSCDRIDRLDFDYMARLTRGIGAAVYSYVVAH